MFKRLKNLWALSRFEITRFDHELVITEKEGALVYARPKFSKTGKALIVDLEEPLDIIEL